MKLTVASSQPRPRPQALVAVIDLAPTRRLCADSSLRAHPAWSDLQRRKGIGPLEAPYLALSARGLLYLPAEAAKYWDDDEKIRTLAGRAWDVACERKAEELVVLLDGPDGADAAPLAAEGLALRAYRFDKYRTAKPNTTEPRVTLVVTADRLAAARAATARRLALVESVNRARDLVNEPGSVATPAYIESEARRVARAAGLTIEVLQAAQLKKAGYMGLITVGKGGAVPPRMIVLHYEPPRRPKSAAAPPPVHLGLLGKGITFDTGGISIKPAAGMWEMKGDMAGAAAVLYAMEAIARERPPIPVTGVLCVAQNAVDANAALPGDIFRARNGKTVHVDNTDAEGRLVLTDGLHKLGEVKATHIVDVATLTGACQRALGHAYSGAFGNDDFVQRVIDVARRAGEPAWPLPMVEEYMEWLKCEVADLNNIASKPLAGATIGALFLREFVPPQTSWAHFDIAGTFFVESDVRTFRPGATGVMVRTLAALAETMSNA